MTHFEFEKSYLKLLLNWMKMTIIEIQNNDLNNFKCSHKVSLILKYLVSRLDFDADPFPLELRPTDYAFLSCGCHNNSFSFLHHIRLLCQSNEAGIVCQSGPRAEG